MAERLMKMPSTPPRVTITLSMSYSRPNWAMYLLATAWRMAGRPGSVPYLVRPSRRAVTALSTMCLGVSKLGSPLQRLTAPG